MMKLKNNVSVTQTSSINKEFDDLKELSYQEVIFLEAILEVQDIPNEYVPIWDIKKQIKQK